MTQEPISDRELERLVREADELLGQQARIPSAGLVYWRASIRARSEAARKVERPFTIVQGLAAAAVVGVGVALSGFALNDTPWLSTLSMPRLPELSPLTTLALCVAALAVISPLALVALASRMRFDRPQD
jgi:hypothetical protein